MYRVESRRREKDDAYWRSVPLGGLGEGVVSLMARVLRDGIPAEGGGGNLSTSVVRVPKLVTGDTSERSTMQSAISGAGKREVCV